MPPRKQRELAELKQRVSARYNKRERAHTP